MLMKFCRCMGLRLVKSLYNNPYRKATLIQASFLCLSASPFSISEQMEKGERINKVGLELHF